MLIHNNVQQMCATPQLLCDKQQLLLLWSIDNCFIDIIMISIFTKHDY